MRLVSEFYERRESLRVLVRRLVADRTARTLDVGCKKGDTTRSIAAGQGRVFGVDIERHDDWSERLQGSMTAIDFVQGDAQHLPYLDASFDVVVACESLQYVPHPEDAIEEMWRVLDADGHLVLSFPEGGPLTDGLDPDNLAHLTRRAIGRPHPEASGYVRHLHAKRIVEHLERRGFVIERHARRGSIAYIQLAAAIDLAEGLRLRFDRAGPRLRTAAAVLIRPTIELLCRLMQLDFAVGYGALSYNNVISARKLRTATARNEVSVVSEVAPMTSEVAGVT